MEAVWRAPGTTTATTAPVDAQRRIREEVDVAVVGAGLSGLATAVQLARSGAAVVVLEARDVGAGTTGSSTGKLSVLQGTRLGEIRDRHCAEVAAAYVAGNRAGLAWLRGLCVELAVPLATRTAVTYAAGPEELPAVEREARASAGVGLDVVWREDDDGVPFPYWGGVALADQAEVDPYALAVALAAEARRAGVRIHTRARVTELAGRTLGTTRGPVRADRIVLATGTPIFDSGGYFARLAAERSYAIALRGIERQPWDMYLSAGAPVRSVRDAPSLGEDALVVGGSSHAVGRASAGAHLDDLRSWARRHWPGARELAAWSAQDYAPLAGLPYVGPLTPGDDRVLVVTGFAKWGLTNAAAAALLIAGELDGAAPGWASAFRPWSSLELPGLRTAVRRNADVGARVVGDRLQSRPPAGGPLPEGAGRVAGSLPCPVAESKVDGVRRTVSATCTHLGGVVTWNNAERTWDCPLHGSRFAPDGGVLEGPARRPLGGATPTSE